MHTDEIRCAGRSASPLLFGLLLAVLLAPFIQAQVGSWTAHPSFYDVRAITSDGDTRWFGSAGGVLEQKADGATRVLTPVEGLHDVDVTAILFDSDCAGEGCLWIGYRDGMIDRFDVATGAVRTLREIGRSDRFPVKAINAFYIGGDTLYVATGFGLVLFDRVRLEVLDAVDRVAALEPGLNVNDVHVFPAENGKNNVWLTMLGGVARAPLDASNLRDPSVWTIETTGLPSTDVRALASFQGRLYAGTANDAAVRSDGAVWSSLGLTSFNIVDFDVRPGLLAVLDRFRLTLIEPNGATHGVEIDDEVTSRAVSFTATDVAVASTVSGLVRFPGLDLGAREEVPLPGPTDGMFEDLDVVPDGTLWAGGPLGTYTGFHRLAQETGWNSFTRRNTPGLETASSFLRIDGVGQEEIWAGTQGSGLVHRGADGAVTRYDEENSTLETAAGYLVAPAVDEQGNVWVTNRGATYPLHVRTPDGAWTRFTVHDCDGLAAAFATYDRIFIDSYGQIWITTVSRGNFQRGIGVVVLDPGELVTEKSDDTCRYIGLEGAGGQGLPSTTVNAVAETTDGLIWLATSEGPAFVENIPVLAQDRVWQPVWPQFADQNIGVWVMEGLDLLDVAADPGAGAWFGTNQGAWHIRRAGSGFEVDRQYIQSNAPLFSNRVQAVAVNPEDGTVYFSTDRGLLSVVGEAKGSAPAMKNLFAFPNPVRLVDGYPQEVFIEGLTGETNIRILTANGHLVARLDASGGRVRWDLTDTDGRLVPSGMYLVIAAGKDEQGTGYGKIAVIR